jgi:hypothetical protein
MLNSAEICFYSIFVEIEKKNIFASTQHVRYVAKFLVPHWGI